MAGNPPVDPPAGGEHARLPADEVDRLAALQRFGPLDAMPSGAFDELTRLAAEICQTPTAFVSIVEEDREVFISAFGSERRDSPRDISFCGHTILGRESLVVPDTWRDPRFADNPNVMFGDRVRFYAGAPLVGRDGHALGALCVKDVEPRQLSELQLRALRVLADQVSAQLELHRQLVDQQRLTAVLRASQQLHRSMIERSPDLVSAVALDGTIRIVSASHEATLGYPVAELVGGPIAAITYPAAYDTVFERVSALLQGRVDDTPLRTQLRHRDGHPVEVETRFSLIGAADGGEPLVLATSRDLTARISLEERYREAERLETVGQLTVAIAHDFNNLLVPILGYSELALKKLGDREADIREDMTQIGVAARQGSALVERLIAASRPASDTLQPTSLNEVIAAALPLVGMMLGGGIEVEFVPGEDLPDCLASAQRLNQLLLNLAANSRDALPGDGGRVAIRTGTGRPGMAAASGDYATLTFADSGSGIDPEDVGHVFEPFFTTKKGTGTGLGLATVARIVGEHRGTIEVDTSLGEGTRFTISLPAA